MKKRTKKLFLIAAQSLVVLLWPAVYAVSAEGAGTLASLQAKPSFSCTQSETLIERTTCADTQLARKDAKLALLYNIAQTSALGIGPSNEQEVQRVRLKHRNINCANDQPDECLTFTDDHRTHDLAIAALFQNPTLALAKQSELQPQTAPIYHAILKYATNDDENARMTAVAPLISPAFQITCVNPAEHTPMTEAPGYTKPLYNNLTNAPEAASSDRNFSTFLAVTSIGHDTKPFGLVMPRAALLRQFTFNGSH